MTQGLHTEMRESNGSYSIEVLTESGYGMWIVPRCARNAGDLAAMRNEIDRLLGEGYRPILRAGTMYLGKTVLRIDDPSGEGYIDVIDYRAGALDDATGENEWAFDTRRAHIDVESPSRRAMIFRLHTWRWFTLDQLDAACAHARALAAAGTFADGDPCTPEELLEIERSEGNPCAEDNWAARRSGRV